jgi:flavin-binding protein dodecin
MDAHVYSVTEVVGSSHDSLDGAIRNAVAMASRSLRNLEWFEVTQIRGRIANNEVGYYQVGLKLGFRYEKEAPPARHSAGAASSKT